jgi:hypothetical protein
MPCWAQQLNMPPRSSILLGRFAPANGAALRFVVVFEYQRNQSVIGCERKENI